MGVDKFFSVAWWQRNWKWLLPGCGCALVLLGAAFVAGLLVFTAWIMRSSGGYQDALARAQQDCEVQRLLGTPVEAGWFASGSTSTTGPSGHSDLSFTLKGPDGSGKLYVIAEKAAGTWRLELLELQPAEGGPGIDLLEADRPTCEAPPPATQ